MSEKPTYEELEQKVKELEQEAYKKKQVELDLKESEEKYRAIVAAFDGLIYVCSQDYRVEFMNDKFIERTGYNPEGELCYKALHKLDSICPWCVNEQVFKGETVRWEIKSPKDDHWYYVVNTPIYHADGSVSKQAMILDITDRKGVEEALRQSEKRLEKINECFLSFGTDSNVNINHLTALCGELLGATCALYNRLDGAMLCSLGQWNIPTDYNPVDTPDGHICYDVIKSAGDETLVITNLPETHYAQTDPNVMSYKLKTYMGRAVKLRDTYVGSLCVVYQDDIDPREADKRVIEIIASAIGVEEERKRMEASLIRTERLSAVGEIASGVAHNFNNLLQIIMGAAEAAMVKLNSSELPKCREAIDSIVETSKRGADIVRRIKDFTLVKTDAIDETRVFDLGELIEEALELTKPLWKNPAMARKYRLNYLRTTGYPVRGNLSEIYEVLVNIIKNGLEAMPKGGDLTIKIEVRNSKVFVLITDTGSGITEENLQRIFQPFFTTKGSKSSGLGLSSSYGIIKRHQGEINVQSVPDNGTTFSITLPLAKPIEMRKEKKASEDTAIPDTQIKLLIIDDEVNILKMMEMWFEDSHVEVHTAKTTKRGLQAIGQNRFDVILCDLGMDDKNGLEVGKTLKDYCHASGIPKTPFMLYTGYDTILDPRVLEASGVDRVVKKPTSAEELLCIIHEVVCER